MTGEINPFAKVLPRHLRFLFFLDHGCSKELILKLIQDNYRLWGGRFNPFIPVRDNLIDPTYLPLLPYFDPDIIYYSPGVDLDKLIQQLPDMRPREYIEAKEYGNNFPGIFSGFLLPDEISSQLFHTADWLVYLSHSLEHSLKSFYQLNFGFSQPFIDDKQMNTGFHVQDINDENILELPKKLNEQKTVNTSLLSEHNAYATRFRPLNDFHANQFELIIYDAENPFDDLIYFWNRVLFQHTNPQVSQWIVSPAELELLKEDVYFELLLLNTVHGNAVMCSKSLDTDMLSELCKSLRAKFQRFSISVETANEFPYGMLDINWNHYAKEKSVKILLKGNQDYLPIPSAFANNFRAGVPGDFVCDISLGYEIQNTHYIRFPRFTNTHLTSRQSARLNSAYELSFFVDEREKGIDLRIPDATEILRSRLTERTESGISVTIGSGQPTYSAAGRKLRAFAQLFDEDFPNMDWYIGDSFWLNLFQGVSIFKNQFAYPTEVNDANGGETKVYKILPKSNIPDYHDIFSHADLENEIRRYYHHYRKTIEAKYEHEGIKLTDKQFHELIERSLAEDFNLSIDPTLQHFLEKKALYLGLRVKCFHCGSNSWYLLKSVDNHMSCSGCHHEISPSVSAPIYYKLNQVITNNIRSSDKLNGKNFDGNYVVLKTLIHLASSHQSGNSFLYAPCMDISYQLLPDKEIIHTDLDILVIQNGKLVIGEAKANATDFKKKETDMLIWVGNNIRPDLILLAYMNGTEPKEKIDLIKAGITFPDVRVESYQIAPAWHRFGRIFGAGTPDDKDDVITPLKKD